MFKTLIALWSGGFLGKAYVIFAAIVLVMVVSTVVANVITNPRKKMDFIVKAQKDNSVTVGKMTCLTIHGFKGPENYHAEYMYVVDGKRYFVTYEMAYEVPKDERMDEMSADMVLLNLKNALHLFYDKDNPKKVMSKLDVFTSYDGIHQIRTPKKNAYRDTEMIWTEAIDLSCTD